MVLGNGSRQWFSAMVPGNGSRQWFPDAHDGFKIAQKM